MAANLFGEEEVKRRTLRIGEVASLAGVNVQTLRYYERRGLLADPGRTPAGYRLYPEDAVQFVRFVKGAQDLGFTLVEVEQLLYTHPAIQDVAVVGMPDERLGERGCAFAVLRPGGSLSKGEMVAFLEEAHMARQYFPEHLELLEEMPRTASGKIQKFRLREMAAELAPSS